MKILSILWSTNSTVALMVEGRIIACVSEERFSRKKNDESYPLKSIEYVLKEGGVDAKDLDVILIAGERFDPTGVLCHKWSNASIQDRLREQTHYWHPILYQGKSVSYLDVFQDKIDTEQYPGKWDSVIDFIKNGNPKKANTFFQDFRREVVSSHLSVDPMKIRFVHHHRAHGYYAYYGSPMEKKKTLILTADAWGDDMNASVSFADNGQVRMINSSINLIIGRLYRYITLLLGMKPDEHEYKVMGLAAYAKPQYYQGPLTVFQNTMYVDNLDFAYHEVPTDLYFYFRDRLEGYRFDSIAGAIQQYTEDILVEWARNALRCTGSRKLCFGGGVGMNIKAMMEIAKLPEVDEIMIMPSPADESLAMGAAYVAMHDICVSRGDDPSHFIKPLNNAYLGPDTSLSDIQEVIMKARSAGHEVMSQPDMQYIAGLLAGGKIIGRCAGRSEFGARALGNRSIIADPRNLHVIKQINEKIKSRDFWMPFAPSILEEKADDYIFNPKALKSPYMTIAFETKRLAQDHLKAGIHQYDLTVRPQFVNKDVNVEYYKLIKAFHDKTGVGGVLNTSFNIHGEPIVQTPHDAYDVFEKTAIDALLLDGYLIEHRN